MLQQLTQPLCTPVSLEQARKHLSIDASDRANDNLINLFIEAATADSQMKTGRIWVESDWEWTPEETSVGRVLQFPIVPVVGVKLYDMTQAKEPEEDDVTDNGPTDAEARRKRAKEQTRAAREAIEEQPDQDRPDEPKEEWPEVSAEYLNVEYPSLDPMGYPAVGGIAILQPFPEKYQLVLTVGYPVKKSTKPVVQYDSPTLVLGRTGFSDNIIRLVFNRPVEGTIYVSNFEIRKKVEEPDSGEDDAGDIDTSRITLLDNTPVQATLQKRDGTELETSPSDILVTIEDVYFIDGAIEIQYARGEINEGDHIQVSFFEGSAYDAFENFVQPIILQNLPKVVFTPPEEFAVPAPLPEEDVFESLSPTPIKNWILTRVGSLYSQRTEIALRAGKSNDAMFPDQFINNLLNPYRVRFFEHVR